MANRPRWIMVAMTSAALPVVAAGAPLATARSAVPAPQVQTQPGAPNAFHSIALKLGTTRYDARWNRVHRASASAALAPLVQPARALPRAQQLMFVNASINSRIRYRFDSDPSGDRWATAGETLAASAGDCEDYVIAKLQALRALGVPDDQLFMTIGEDAAVGAVHAVLLAKVGDGYWVLDNRTNKMVPDNQYKDFYPIITFGAGKSWLHGYARGTTPAAVRRMDIAFNARRDLPTGNSAGSVTRRS